ncbi:MAG: hypothetical protein OCD00_17125 [Colwellia sp.]
MTLLTNQTYFSFHYFSKDNSHKAKVNKKLNIISAIVLMAFLFAFISHAQHFTESVVSAEQQHCYICHQGIDTPPDISTYFVILTSAYAVFIVESTVPAVNVSTFIQPPLRAPPAFSIL